MGRKEKPMPVGKTHIPTIGELLRRFRNERNLSLTEMAVLTNFSNSHLSNVEAGRAQPSKDLLKNYEEYLGLKPNKIGAFFPSVQRTRLRGSSPAVLYFHEKRLALV